jgi:hypothetical protein
LESMGGVSSNNLGEQIISHSLFCWEKIPHPARWIDLRCHGSKSGRPGQKSLDTSGFVGLSLSHYSSIKFIAELESSDFNLKFSNRFP